MNVKGSQRRASEATGSAADAHERAAAGAGSARTPRRRHRAPAPVRPGALGLCFLLSLQHQLTGFLYPSSASLAVSPLFASGAAAVLLLAYCYASYRKDAAVFSTRWSIALSVAATVAAVTAGALMAEGAVSGAAGFAAAVVIGFSLAALTYTWATVYARMEASSALLAGMASLLLSGVLDFAGMRVVSFCGAWPPIAAFGLGACACFIAETRAGAPKGDDRRARPVLYLPAKMKEHAKLVCGIALYALALGVVAGTTAANSTSENMGALNASVNELHIGAALVMVAATVALGRRASLALFLRVFTPVLVVVFLMNIVVPQYSDVLLACTFFAWTLLQLFTFLLAAHIARQRIASLSLAFPIVWSLVLCGNALGILAGQLYVLAWGNEQQAVFAMAVVLTVIVVAASSLLLGNANTALASARPSEPEAPSELPEARANGGARADNAAPAAPASPNAPNAPAAPAAPEPTPLEAACAALARSHNLSEREAEVFTLLARGYTRTSIAKKLFVSENTVRVHVKNVYAKLYVHSKQQLIDLVEAKAGLR